MRYLMGAAIALLILVSQAAAARAEVVEIHSVAVWMTSFGSELEITAAAPPRWTLRYESDGGFVLRLPGSRPSEEVTDLELEDGLVESVSIDARVDRGEPSTFIHVRPRERLRVSVRPIGETLRVFLSAIEETESDAPAPEIGAAGSAVISGEPLPSSPEGPTRSEAIDLESQLAASRSQLSAARAEIAALEQVVATNEENLERAWGAQQTLSARLAELQEATERSRADRQRLSDSLSQQGDESRALAHAAESLNLERERLELQLADAEAARDSSGQRVARLEQELAAAARELDEVRGAAVANESELRTGLQRAQAESDSLRRDLASAREALTLGSTTYVVLSTVDPCLNVRPEPGADSRVDCLPPGTRLAVLDLSGDWGQVRLPDGRLGWAAFRFLEASPATPSELEELQRAQADLERQRALAQETDAALDEAATREAELVSRLEALDRELEDSRALLTASEDRVARLQTDSEAATLSQQRISELEGEVARLLGQAEAATTEIAAMKAAATENQRELHTARDRAEESSRRTADLENELQQARATAEEATAELASLQGAAVESERELEALRASSEQDSLRTSELESELQRARAAAEKAAAEIGSLGAAAVERERELQALRSAGEESARQTAELQDQLRQLRLDFDAAAAEAAALRRSSTELGREVERLRGEGESAGAALAEARQAASDSERRATDLDAELSRLQAANTAAVAELEQLRSTASAMERLEVEAARLKASSEAAAAELEALRQTATAEQSRSAELQGEVERLSDENTDLGQELAALRQTADQSDRRLEELAGQVSRLKADDEAAAAEIETLRQASSDTEQLRERLGELQLELRAAMTASAELELRSAELATAREALSAAEDRAAQLEAALASGERARDQVASRITELESELRTAHDSAGAVEADLRRQLAQAEAALEESRAALALGGSTYVVHDVASCLNLRARPGTGAPLDCLAPGTRVAVLDVAEEWARVRTDPDLEGWASLEFLEPAPALPAEVAEAENLRGQLAELRQSSASAAASQAERVLVLESERDSALAETQELTASLNAETERSAAAETELAELRRSAETSTADQAEHVRAIEAERDAALAEAQELTASLGAETERRTAAETELTELRRSAETSTADQAERVRAIEAERDAAVARSEELAASLAAASEQRSAAEARLVALQERAEASTAEQPRTLEGELEAERLESALEDTRAENRELRAQLAEAVAAQAELEQSRAALSQLRAELFNARAELTRAERHDREPEPRSADKLAEGTEAPRPSPPAPSPSTTATETLETASASDETPPAAADPILLQARVLDWAAAWSAQDVDSYLAFYSHRFSTEDGADRAAWERQRRDRLSRPKFVIVELSELEVLGNNPSQPSVTFTQLYRSNTFTDTVRKRLVFVREDGSWRILREVSAEMD